MQLKNPTRSVATRMLMTACALSSSSPRLAEVRGAPIAQGAPMSLSPVDLDATLQNRVRSPAAWWLT